MLDTPRPPADASDHHAQGALLRRRQARAGSLPAGLRGSAASGVAARLAALEEAQAALGGALGDVARDVARTRAKLRLATRDAAAPRRATAEQLQRTEQALIMLQGAWSHRCCRPFDPVLTRSGSLRCADEHAGLASAVDALSGVVRKQFRVLAAGIKRVGAARGGGSAAARANGRPETVPVPEPVPATGGAADPWGDD